MTGRRVVDDFFFSRPLDNNYRSAFPRGKNPEWWRWWGRRKDRDQTGNFRVNTRDSPWNTRDTRGRDEKVVGFFYGGRRKKKWSPPTVFLTWIRSFCNSLTRIIEIFAKRIIIINRSYALMKIIVKKIISNIL